MDGDCFAPFAVAERSCRNDLTSERPEVARPGPSLTRAEPDANSARDFHSHTEEVIAGAFLQKFIAMRLPLGVGPPLLDTGRAHAISRRFFRDGTGTALVSGRASAAEAGLKPRTIDAGWLTAVDVRGICIKKSQSCVSYLIAKSNGYRVDCLKQVTSR